MGADLASIVQALKREHIGDMILQVKRLSAEQQYVQARDQLQQLLKLDHQHTEARRMLAEVQQHLSRKQRDEQAQQLSLKAEDLIRSRDLEQAIDLLDQASRLVPEDNLIAAMLDDARKKRVIQEEVERILRKADEARTTGDFEGAKAIVEKAMELDATDPRVQTAYTALARQVEEAAQRARARKLLDDARQELKLRRYAEALILLREAEHVDPFHPELAVMISAATTGAQQEQRRKILDEVEREVARAITWEQAKTALAAVQAAVEKTGSDPVLLRLQAQVMRQVRDFEAKKLVEDTVRECRAKQDTTPLEALKIVQAALLELPANEHLLTLQTSIEERVARLSRDDRRASYLKQAHKAIAENRFADAVEILEGCQGELQSPEIGELLEFARNEVFQEEHRRYIAGLLTEGQQLIREHAYDDAIAYLEPLAEQTNEPALRTLLEQARTQQRELYEKAQTAARQVEPLLQVEGYEQVLAYLQTLPQEVHAMPALQAALTKAQEGLERERAQVAFLGQSYAALLSKNPPADWSGTEAVASTGVMAEMTRALERRRLGLATRTITAEIEIVRAKILTGDVHEVDELIKTKAPLVAFCSDETRTEWNALIEQHEIRKNSGTMSKFGRKQRPN
jgi:tetratricopeptide (TPR) repeat protein